MGTKITDIYLHEKSKTIIRINLEQKTTHVAPFTNMD